MGEWLLGFFIRVFASAALAAVTVCITNLALHWGWNYFIVWVIWLALLYGVVFIVNLSDS